MSGRWLLRLGGVVLAVGSMAASASAEPERLYSYPVGIGQTGPRGTLARGPDGTLYAALYGLGPSSRGSVVAYRPPTMPGGNWTIQLLHGFSTATAAGGLYPQAGVTLGPNGELYGTTVQGGANDRGVVFRLTPPVTPGDPWTKDILHEFGLSPGFYPSSNLLLEPDGTLYGVTEGGGPANCGLVFRLRAPNSGRLPWNFKTLASFAPETGCNPRTTPKRGADGNLYGALLNGGPDNLGAVYSLELKPNGAYRLKTLISFKPRNGMASPTGDIALDGAGAVIGAARNGGADGCGGVYRVGPPSGPGSGWSFEPLRRLSNNGSGCGALGVAREQATGVLAVTTYQGGVFNVGALLNMTPRSTGPSLYRFRLRESFGPSYNYPQGSPIFGPDGEVYGSTTDAISIWRSQPAP